MDTGKFIQWMLMALTPRGSLIVRVMMGDRCGLQNLTPNRAWQISKVTRQVRQCWPYKGPIPPGLERDGCGEKVAYCYRYRALKHTKLFSLQRVSPSALAGQSDFPRRAFNVSS